MKRSKFSESQIITILKAVETGRTVADVCREHEIAQTTYYKWKQKYGGRQALDIKRLRELEEENRKLKQMYAELSLDHLMLKEVPSCCWGGLPALGVCGAAGQRITIPFLRKRLPVQRNGIVGKSQD